MGSARVLTATIGCGLQEAPEVLKPRYIEELTSPRGELLYMLMVALGVVFTEGGCA